MYVGIDIGGTRCRVLTTHDLDKVEKRARHEFVLTHTFDADMVELMNTIRHFVPAGETQAIGLSTPGNINDKKTMIFHAKNLPEWSGKPVKSMLEQAFHCPVRMDNDGVAAALGEAYFGQGRDKNFCFVIWGTGIGGASVQRATNVNCTMLDWHTYFQAWEQDCGGNAVSGRYAKGGHELTEGEWSSVMIDFTRRLKDFIAQTDARTIIFGGGVAVKQKERLLALQRKFPTTELLVSGLGEDAGLYGALALLKLGKA